MAADVISTCVQVYVYTDAHSKSNYESWLWKRLEASRLITLTILTNLNHVEIDRSHSQ